MRVATTIAFLAILVACVYAGRTILAEKNLQFNEKAWKLGPIAPGNEEMTVRLFLKHTEENLHLLNREFEMRTNPQSKLWRKWLSNEEIKKIVSPPKQNVQVVLDWINEYPVLAIENHGDCILFNATIKVINEMFETKLYTFNHIESGYPVYRHLKEYSLPQEVEAQVEFVIGINGFPNVGRSFAHRNPVFDDETYKVVPYVIDQLYNIDYTLASKVSDATSIGVAEFQDTKAWSATDLSTFQTENGLPQNPIPKDQIIGPYSDTYSALEPSLDVQYAGGVSYSANNWYYTVKGWMLEFCDDIMTATTFPYVISISWGWTEDSQCQITACGSSSEYVSRVNTEFQKIGLKGITLVASSGDQGAPGDGNPYCFNKTDPINSIFPGASPYVLSVGATMLVTPYSQEKTPLAANDQPVPPICSTQTCADPSTLQEVACSYPTALITTGGGFSVYSPRPSWQDSVVSTYLSTGSNLPTSYFNASNRGFPDVAGLGHNYIIQWNGESELVDGTSCSAPVWGAMIALLNLVEINAGNPTLGFINPLIYQAYGSNSAIFNDIVNGNNLCTESSCCQYGFSTAKGWDAVTGLGSPNFGSLLTYIQSL